MTTWNDYQDVAQAYATGVRTMLAPGASAAGPEVVRGTAPAATLAAQAEQLAPISDHLTSVAAGWLTDLDPFVRAQGATRLLAKALTDLQVSIHLLGAAGQEAQPGAARGPAVEGLPALDLAGIEANLGLLLESPLTAGGPAVVARGTATPTPVDLGVARLDLARAVVDTLVSIRDQAARTGQVALGGLLGLGAAQLAQAAGIVGLDIAKALGQAEQVTRLYNLFRDYALRAYDSLVALLGPALARMAASQITAWVAALQSGQEFGKLLEKLYDTSTTGAALGQLAANSQAAPDKFTTSTQTIRALRDQYTQQIALSDKLLHGLALFGMAPAAALPQGRLLLAATFIVLGSYVILAGADFVDAPRLRLLNRVPGVREVVEANLGERAPSRG